MPHLVIQGSYALEENKDAIFTELAKQIFKGGLIATSIDSTDENQMKNYLLQKDKRLKMV